MHKYIVAEWGGVSGSSYQSVDNWGSVFILTLIIFPPACSDKISKNQTLRLVPEHFGIVHSCIESRLNR